jgi:hypothetical protein
MSGLGKLQFGSGGAHGAGHSAPVYNPHKGEAAYIEYMLDTNMHHGDTFEARQKQKNRKHMLIAGLITLGGIFASRRHIDRWARQGLKRLRALIP